MKKNVYEDFRGDKDLRGFTQEIKWKLTSHYGGPKEYDCYMVADGNGDTEHLFCTGEKCMRDEILMILEGPMRGRIKFVWEDTFEDLTRDEILALCDKKHIWYKRLDAGYEPGDRFIHAIYRDSDIPKYFLEAKFTGPIDSKIDTYEEVIDKDVNW